MRLLGSLKAKLLLSMMLVVLITIVILSLSIVRKQNELAYEEATAELDSLSGMVAANTTAAILFADNDAARRTLEGLAALPDIESAVIFDGGGRVFTRFGGIAPNGTGPDPDLVRGLLSRGESAITRDSRGLYAYKPVTSEGEVIGLVYIVNNMQSLTRRLQEFSQVVVVTGLLAFLSSSALIFWLQSLVSQPLRQMISVIQQIIVNRDYSQRTPGSAIAEFNLLSDNFNEMISEVEARGRKLESINQELEQRVLERTQDLETALRLANEGNRAKSEFLAVMSHEVRTPLNGIMGFLELLKLAPTDVEVKQLVDSLDRSAQNLLELLNEILDFSKLDANKIELERYDFDLGELVDSVIETYRPLARQKNLSLRAELDRRDTHCVGDATRLRQILGNFISNAIKFTERGSITVTLETSDFNAETVATFRIHDSGIGIPREKLGDIFSPFIQGDSSITRRFGGTGLGLAIARQLIELMQGSYGVQSEPGQGSCFWFTIPLSRQPQALPAEERPKASAAPASQQPAAILIAEDNPLNREVIVNLLNIFGHHCEHADNGAQAVEMAAKKAYDLILMDYHMPVMDGVQATVLIREQGPNSATPIIALTADIQPHVNKLFKRAGANALLIKPFTLADLEASIAQWLHHEAPPRPASQTGERPEPEDGEAPVLNRKALEEIAGLSADEGSALVTRIAGIFFEQLPALQNKVHQALEANDGEALFQAAHSIKSSAANVGGMRLSRLARELEGLAREKRLDEAGALAGQLDDCAARTLEELDKALGVF